MSITDFRAAKREDQESRARLAREADELRARLAREERQQVFEQELARQAALQEEKDREAARIRKDREAKEAAELAKRQADLAAKSQADKEKRREQVRRRKERRERFVAQVNAAPKWFAQHLDLAAALVVMACSIVPALMSQAASLKTTGIVAEMGWLGWLLIALLPVMLECSAWAATAGEAKAMKEQRSPWPYRIAVYVFAGLAARINYLHGSHVGGDKYGVILGSVLAASSIIPIVVWQLVQIGRHRDYRDAMKAARQARKDAKKTRKVRKKELPKVWETAVRLRAIAGYERLSEEEAWLVAYGVFEGAVTDVLSDELLRLLSADMLGNLVDAEGRRTAALEDLTAVRLERQKLSEALTAKEPEKGSGGSVNGSADGAAILPAWVFEASSTGIAMRPGTHALRTVSPQINTSVPPPVHTSETAPARTRDTARPRTRKARAADAVRKMSPGAKKAAAQTARTASAEENAAVEAWALAELRAGRTLDRKGVEAETVRRREEVHGVRAAAKLGAPSKTWCYDLIARVKKARGPHLVSDQRSA